MHKILLIQILFIFCKGGLFKKLISFCSVPLQYNKCLMHSSLRTGEAQTRKAQTKARLFHVFLLRLVWCNEFSIRLQSRNPVIHLYIYNWTCCINQIPALNGAFHGTLIRSDATRQQIYLLASCQNKPHLKQNTLTFWIRCLCTAANKNSGEKQRVMEFSTIISLLSLYRPLSAGQMNSYSSAAEKL